MWRGASRTLRREALRPVARNTVPSQQIPRHRGQKSVISIFISLYVYLVVFCRWTLLDSTSNTAGLTWVSQLLLKSKSLCDLQSIGQYALALSPVWGSFLDIRFSLIVTVMHRARNSMMSYFSSSGFFLFLNVIVYVYSHSC